MVSILIPAYNAEDWIAETIQSALAQTWVRKEIIVVDDGSSDQTLAIARRFASSGVSVVAKLNEGAAATRNVAFTHSRGDYIQWLDADDLLSPDKLEWQMKEVMRNPDERVLLSSAWAHFMYRSRRARFKPNPLWQDLSPVNWLIRKMGQDCHMQTATWLVSRKLTESAGLWDTRLLGDDDGEYFCRVILGSKGIRFIPEAKVYYRMTAATRLSYVGSCDKKIAAQFVSMQLHVKYLRSIEDSQRTRAACVQYLQKYIWYFIPERPDIVAKIEHLALSLDGQLDSPQVRPKYALIQKLFGWKCAKRVQILLPRIKWSVLRFWDKVLFLCERSNLGKSAVKPVGSAAQLPR